MRETVAQFKRAGLAFGHGTHNARDEAAYLILHTLRLPLGALDSVLERQLSASELDALRAILRRRMRERTPAAYLTREAWLGEFRFYVDERAIVPRSFIAELLRDAVAPWIADALKVRAALDLYTGKAEAIRAQVTQIIGDNLASVKPGSREADEIKRVLVAQGAWSQYLEVGIGPDAEIFTKSQVMSAVGLGAEVGLHPKSSWNNPEPEIVLAVTATGETVGATLGNDVNLRDFGGRSALLLGKCKDNNASCAIGPFIRLFDERFGIDDVRQAELALEIAGTDGFVLDGASSMSKISRDPLDIVTHAWGPFHQYPDGFMLFLGTMFAPVKDRGAPGMGFTHKVGDLVSISTPKLGRLANRVTTSDRAPPWTFGISALMQNLAARGLLH